MCQIADGTKLDMAQLVLNVSDQYLRLEGRGLYWSCSVCVCVMSDVISDPFFLVFFLVNAAEWFLVCIDDIIADLDDLMEWVCIGVARCSKPC